MASNDDNGSIGADDDPFGTMMINLSYNGSNGNNGFNDDNGSNGDNVNNNSNG